MPEKTVVLGIDAGGTSWKLFAANGPNEVLAKTAIPTREPDATIAEVCDWVKAREQDGLKFTAIGLAIFGPIDRDSLSPNYGGIFDATKPGWSRTNPRVELERRLGLPCFLDTDVNGALLAEVAWGEARGLTDVAYVTVGTGVGGAAIVNNNLVGAPSHGEFGHIRPVRPAGDIAKFSGACQFHGDCVEGLASASAVRARWNVEPHELAENHEAWPIIANALAHLCLSMTYLIAPQRIILGGGVMRRESLFPRVRKDYQALANGFGLRSEAKDADTYILQPGLGDDAGALGGVWLALNKAKTAR